MRLQTSKDRTDFVKFTETKIKKICKTVFCRLQCLFWLLHHSHSEIFEKFYSKQNYFIIKAFEINVQFVFFFNKLTFNSKLKYLTVVCLRYFNFSRHTFHKKSMYIKEITVKLKLIEII